MRLILIRHGEAHHSINGLIAGERGCTGLTERGIAQSRALARRLAATGELRDCAAPLCSPVRRARQTADLLVGSLPGARLGESPDLRELHPGDTDGLSWDDYRARFGAFDLRAEPQRPFAPGGETWAAFNARVQTLVPTTLQGRMNATMRFIGMSVIPIDALLGGALGERIGLRPTLVLGSIGPMFAPLWLYCSPLRSRATAERLLAGRRMMPNPVN